jgi:hypothetical protein
MTTWYLGMNRGQIHPGQITVGTSLQSADFNLAILSTNTPKKEDVILALRNFEMYILANGMPAGQTGVDLPVN